MNKENFINWLTDIILQFEKFFHQVQEWLDGPIYNSESGWFQNLIETTTEKKD
jgi:hypothetical protein